jgi:dienelactone hydrolase
MPDAPTATAVHADTPTITIAPYGSWKSPITSDAIVAATVTLGQLALDGDALYWLEQRPSEGGRSVVVRRGPDGTIDDVTPPPFNVRTRVHEYGGGAYAVAGGTVYFANYADQRLYRLTRGGAPEPITAEGAFRYADLVVDRRRNRLLCVREDHSASSHDPANTIVAIPLGEHGSAKVGGQGGSGPAAGSGDAPAAGGATVLVSGNDFYASPRLSPDGSRLAWLTWNHPNMPWDGTELWVADVREDGSLGPAERIAGGTDESVFQPEWAPADGDSADLTSGRGGSGSGGGSGGVPALYFVSDRTGWGNLYCWRGGEIQALTRLEAELGSPQWVFGLSTYAFESPSQIVCRYASRGDVRLATLDLGSGSGRLEERESPFTSLTRAQSVLAKRGTVYFIGASPTHVSSVVEVDLGSGGHRVLRRSSDLALDKGYVSVPRAIEFPTTGGRTAHGFFYAPRNKDFVAPPGERPPLVVNSHGGPTAATSSALSAAVQFWTSRGIAVLDVNYGGSTGYGRDYRLRLDGQWGIVDVDDCCNGARFLAEQGEVDGARLAISGGSAGGYTTLCALTFRDVFAAGASHYGVSDLEALAKETHKFEARYLDRLVGPYPERRDLYLERSPIHHAARLSRPVIFFQGLDDPVVPPNQAERMVAALREKGVPVAYVPFEGESHGFRKAPNVKRALDAELYFYGRIFGFEPADEIEPVPIENLPHPR